MPIQRHVAPLPQTNTREREQDNLKHTQQTSSLLSYTVTSLIPGSHAWTEPGNEATPSLDSFPGSHAWDRG